MNQFSVYLPRMVLVVTVWLGLNSAPGDSIADRPGRVSSVAKSAADQDSAAKDLGPDQIRRQAVVAALVQALGDDHWLVRATAVDALGGLGDLGETAIAQVAALLTDRVMAVRATAASTLRSLGKSAVNMVGPLTGALQDPFAEVRGEAALALGEIGPSAAPSVPQLIVALSDGDKRVRRAAVGGLAGIGPGAKAAVPALVAMLRDPDGVSRRDAALALGRIGPDAKVAVPMMVELIKEEEDFFRRYQIGSAVIGIGPDAVEAVPTLLRYAMRDGSKWWRYNVYSLLEHIGPGAVPGVLEVLQDQDPHTAWYAQVAMFKLDQIGPETESAVRVLLDALKDHPEEDRFRTCVAIGLARIAPDRDITVPLLVRAVKQADGQVSSAAARALGRMGPLAHSAVPELTELLQDDRAYVRAEAAEILGQIGPRARSAVPLLLALARDKKTKVGLQQNAMADLARSALRSVGDAAAPALIQAIRDGDELQRDTAMAVLNALSEQVLLPVLIALLNDRDSDVRSRAALGLARRGPSAKEAITPLLKLLDDQEPAVVRHAAVALRRIGCDPALLPKVDPGPHLGVRRVRRTSVKRKMQIASGSPLVRIGRGTDALAPLLSRLAHESEDVRWNAARVVTEIVSENKEAMAIGLADKAPELTLAAARAVSLAYTQQADESAIQRLCQWANRQDPFLRHAAVLALGCTVSSDTQVIRVLIGALGDSEVSVRAAAAVGLGFAGRPAQEAMDGLVKALRDQNKRVRLCAAWALGQMQSDHEKVVQALERALKDEEQAVCLVATEALGRMAPKTESTVDVLFNAVTDPQFPHRYPAAWALGRLGPNNESVVWPLIQWLEQNDQVDSQSVFIDDLDIQPATEALVEIGAVAVTGLVTALGDKNEILRLHAAEILARIGPEAKVAVPALTQALLDDENDDVRKEAAEALASMGRVAKAAVPALASVVDDENPELQDAVMVALKEIGIATPAVTDQLMRMLPNQDNQDVARTLAAIHATDPTTLIRAIRHEPAEVRSALVWPLRRCASSYTFDVIEQLLDEDHPWSRWIGHHILADVMPPLAANVRSLVDMLYQDEPQARTNAGQALVRMGPRATPALIASIEGTGLRDTGIRYAVDTMGKILHDVDGQVEPYKKGGDHSSEQEDDRSGQRLMFMLADNGPEQWAQDQLDQVIDTLGGLWGSGGLFDDGHASEVIDRYEALRKRAVPVLIEVARDKDPYVRTAAVGVMVPDGFGSSILWRQMSGDQPAVVASLVKATSDPHHLVRAVAVRMLEASVTR